MDLQKIVLSNPGTPFDWEHPEAYQPPAELTAEQIQRSIEHTYVSLGGEVPTAELDTKHAEVVPSKVPGYVKTIAKIAFLTTILIPQTVRTVPIMFSNLQGLHCPDVPPEPPIEQNRDLNQVRRQVAEMEFGIDKPVYDNLKLQLEQSTTNQEVQSVLQKAMEPYNASVELADMPQTHIGIFETADPREHHSPDLLTVDEAKASGDAFLLSLSQIPRTFLRQLDGFHLYFTHAPSLGDKDVGGAYVFGSAVKGENIVLDTSFPQDLSWSFKHELTHVLHRKQCGDDDSQTLKTGKNDPAYMAKNPQSFAYTTDRKMLRDAKKQNTTPSEYAATSYTEDVAEVGTSLMTGWYSLDHSRIAPILAQKQQLVAERFNQIEPNFEAYATYLAYVGNRPFPKEIAKAESLTTECFETPGIDPPQAVIDKLPLTLGLVHVSGADLPDGNYQVLRVNVIDKDKTKTIYQIGWDKQILGGQDDQVVRKQLGYSLLSYLRDRKEISPNPVNFMVNDYNPKHYGQMTVACSAIEITS